ncbi:hypothetical protein [Calothrix parietina]|uniref:Transposase n=2 Tax=Calothrix TaxID=1186 RepID=A0ABR8AA70_9CYAN|nr:hypothetical protein [Calothrix parietina FACHB-288]MBD2225435.1 hypothetical protein [Calothrix anomala FACHB-343]
MGYGYTSAVKCDADLINDVMCGLSQRAGKPRPYGMIIFLIGITHAQCPMPHAQKHAIIGYCGISLRNF